MHVRTSRGRPAGRQDEPCPRTLHHHADHPECRCRDLGTIDAVSPCVRAVADASSTFSRHLHVEYVLRLWSAVEREPQDSRLRPRLRFAISWPPIIDLLASCHLLRCSFRGPARASSAAALPHGRLLKTALLACRARFRPVVHKKREELTIALSHGRRTTLISTSLNTSWNTMPSQPPSPTFRQHEVGGTALTTVGYGDVVPITAGGKLLV